MREATSTHCFVSVTLHCCDSGSHRCDSCTRCTQHCTTYTPKPRTETPENHDKGRRKATAARGATEWGRTWASPGAAAGVKMGASCASRRALSNGGGGARQVGPWTPGKPRGTPRTAAASATVEGGQKGVVPSPSTTMFTGSLSRNTDGHVGFFPDIQPHAQPQTRGETAQKWRWRELQPSNGIGDFQP